MTQRQIEEIPLQPGEYTLASIMIMGMDPLTGRTSEECEAEWCSAFVRVTAEIEALKWWQWKRRIAVAKKSATLRDRLGADASTK